MKRQKKKKERSASKVRFNIVSAFVYLIGLVLIGQLFNLQIIHGAEYREKSNTRLSRESILEADRGNIKDCYGNIMATVQTEYAVDLYKTLNDNEALNNLLVNLILVFDANGEKYSDDFLIEVDPYRFLLTNEEDQKTWKRANNLDENLSAEEVYNYFKDRYKVYGIDDIHLERKVVAQRFEITFKGYSSVKSIRLAENVSLETIHIIEEQNSKFPGVTITEKSYRTYPLNNTGSHILGRIGAIEKYELEGHEDVYDQHDIIGKDGIEYTFEKYLKGQNGVKQIDMAVDGTVTAEYTSQDAVSGSDVILTVDSKLQKVTEEALANNIHKIANGGFGSRYPADAGSVVVMNVRTGEILAMANYPDYNPNDFVGGITTNLWNYYINGDTKPLENKAIATMYSPGSTYKMVTAIAGLQTGAISTSSTIGCSGVYSKYNSRWNCWYTRGHGRLNVTSAIKQSCNYFFYEVGDRVGIDNLAHYTYYLGLGHKTGVELSGEVSGVYSSRAISDSEDRVWNLGDTISSAIGQSYNTFTPLQMAKYIAILVNGGKQIDVSIVKSVVNADGSEVPRAEYEAYVKEKLGLPDDHVEEQLFDEKNVRAILEGMKDVTSESGGTAYSTFKDFNITVGGKTGSAQTGVKGKTNAWFVGFAPYENPEIAIAVFVRNGGAGSYTAEVARDIIAQYFGMNAEEVYENTQALPGVQFLT